MKKSKAAKIIESVAIREGKSISEIRSNMQDAINIAYKNRDGKLGDFWSRWNGRPPTPKEFIIATKREVSDRLDFKNPK